MRYLFLALVSLSLFLSSASFATESSELSQSVNVLWVVIAGVLVFLMQAGFALVESGMARAKNSVNVLMKNYMDACVRQQQAQRVRKNIDIKQAEGANRELLVFVALIERLIEGLYDDMATRTRLYILENLTKVKISSQERWALQQWLNRVTPLKNDMPLDHTVMQHVINLAYVAVCEYLGPSKADQVLQASVSQIKIEFPDMAIDFLL